MRWPLQPLQPLQKTQLQPPFSPSVDSLCHPWITTTNLSYRFPILKLPPPPCAALLVSYLSIQILGAKKLWHLFSWKCLLRSHFCLQSVFRYISRWKPLRCCKIGWIMLNSLSTMIFTAWVFFSTANPLSAHTHTHFEAKTCSKANAQMPTFFKHFIQFLFAAICSFLSLIKLPRLS